MIVLLDDELLPSLRSLSQLHGWPIVCQPNPHDLSQSLQTHKPSVVTMQVRDRLVVVKQATRFIRWLRRQDADLSIMAVADVHQSGTEQALRQAGVACYSVETDGHQSITQHLIALLEKRNAEAVSAVQLEALETVHS